MKTAISPDGSGTPSFFRPGDTVYRQRNVRTAGDLDLAKIGFGLILSTTVTLRHSPDASATTNSSGEEGHRAADRT
jgi:hypothetical protein